ncbi:hypothetical protein L484_001631 [Morus notabilis]|uniref:Uncharacterized protein n=1 Tax=Morus notabilis TaxID=981085 RepID=W9SDB6_9ROSA|nr:hypothetical protein L484_001631 [Morus notabilis]
MANYGRILDESKRIEDRNGCRRYRKREQSAFLDERERILSEMARVSPRSEPPKSNPSENQL